MVEHKRTHDKDPVGIFIGIYRLTAITATSLLMGIITYYWDDMKNNIDKVVDSFHEIAVNLHVLKEFTYELKENQKDIVVLVSKNSDKIDVNADNINDNVREIDKLKLRVNYLEK